MKMIVSRSRPATGGYHTTTLIPAKGEDGIYGQVEMLTKRKFKRWDRVTLSFKVEEKPAGKPAEKPAEKSKLRITYAGKGKR